MLPIILPQVDVSITLPATWSACFRACRARAVSGKTSLVCIAGFTIVDDENPDGRTISPGQDFEVYDVDLHKYAGKGVRRAPEGR